MLKFLTRYAPMRVVLTLIACVISVGAGAANADEPVVTVAPLLLTEPSTEETTTDLGSVGVPLTEPGELIPGDTVYAEIWFKTLGPNGIAYVLLDMAYETALLDTSVEQITVAFQWADDWVTVRAVDDAAGLITDLGGASITGLGLEPNWAKLATIEFDVIETPGTGITVCTVYGRPPHSGFGMAGIGRVEEVDYRCTCRGKTCAATLVAASPEHGKSLWRSQHNIARLLFDADIVPPAQGEVMIQELLPNGQFGPDLSHGFTFSVESDGGSNPRVLRVWEDDSILMHRKWYAVRNVGLWDGVTPFELHYLLQVGDADGNMIVISLDVGAVNAGIPCFANCGDDNRLDTDGDFRVISLDVGVVNRHIGSFTVSKPGGH